MKKSRLKMDLICEKWAPLAQEYAKFLNRYNLETVCIISKRVSLGFGMSVFADGAEYLRLSFENKKFIEEEKQIDELLGIIEHLTDIVYDDDDYEDEEYEDYEEYDEECDYPDSSEYD